MIKCYTELHKVGYGYSFETYFNGELVGGLYGVKLGRVFIGESMFHKVTDASKSAFVVLKEFCLKNDIKIIDCQIRTLLLRNFGGVYLAGKNISIFNKLSGFYTIKVITQINKNFELNTIVVKSILFCASKRRN
jgi:leucyl/phenylalanyl-tRNA--protein transferase